MSSVQAPSHRMEINCQEIDKIKKGDHIGFHRPYKIWHHAIVEDIDIESNTILVTHNAMDGIQNEWLDVSEEKGDLYVFNYPENVTNQNPPDVVLSRAKKEIGKKEYNLATNNCEHFATFCKTGESYSQQVSSGMTKIGLFGIKQLCIIAAENYEKKKQGSTKDHHKTEKMKEKNKIDQVKTENTDEKTKINYYKAENSEEKNKINHHKTENREEITKNDWHRTEKLDDGNIAANQGALESEHVKFEKAALEKVPECKELVDELPLLGKSAVKTAVPVIGLVIAFEAANRKCANEVIKEVGKTAANKTIQEVGKTAGREAVKKGIETAGIKAVQEAGKAAEKKTVQEAGKAAAKKAVEEVGKSAGKKAVHEAGKAAGSKAVKEAGKAAGQKAVHEAGKAAGSKAVQETGKAAGKKSVQKVVKTTGNMAVQGVGKAAGGKTAQEIGKSTGNKTVREMGKTAAKKVNEGAGKVAANSINKAGNTVVKNANNVGKGATAETAKKQSIRGSVGIAVAFESCHGMYDIYQFDQARKRGEMTDREFNKCATQRVSEGVFSTTFGMVGGIIGCGVLSTPMSIAGSVVGQSVGSVVGHAIGNWLW